MPAVDQATRGHFCTTAAGAAVPRAVWGRFCDVDVIIPTPPRGGGGSGPGGPGVRGPSPNQAPPKIDDRLLYIDQAHHEDEELILLLRAFAEVVQWH